MEINNNTNNTPGLMGMPMEILFDIYHHLDTSSIYKLSLANRFFQELFQHKKLTILLPVLAREFSPFDELLQVHTAAADDLVITAGGLYTPRRIIFKRFIGDAGILLAHGSSVSDDFTQVEASRKPAASTALATTVTLTEEDLRPVIELCQLTRRWEELFPSMRWFYEPGSCRTLRPHENKRFRRAFYRWWLYGIYFHGDLPRPRVGLPEPFIDDLRASQMRHSSTTELLELMDLVETMKDVILHYICPRLDPTPQAQLSDQPALIDSVDRAQSLTDSWNDQSRWGRIVKTYAKLGPKDLMYYFDNIYNFPRKRLIKDIGMQHPNLTFDQESIQITVRCVLDERQWLEKVPSLAEDTAGGIIDFDDERDAERHVYGKDGSPDGGLPEGIKFVRSYSQYSPRGDDGSCLEDLCRMQGFDRPAMPSYTLGAVMPWA